MTNQTTRPGRDQGIPVPAPAETQGPLANPLVLEVDGLRYEADRAPARDGRRACLSVRLASGAEPANFFDRVDLYAFRSRQRFASIRAEHFAGEADAVMGH